MAVYDNLVTYFNRTIKPYNPYKSNKTFQAISSILRDEFLKDAYDVIPTNMSNYVNDQKINIPLYNKLLIGNGYPEDIVNSITSTDKADILNNLMHYQNESGSLIHFRDISKTFNDKFNLYELYADYRWFNKNGQYVFDWVLVGNPIYTVNDDPCDIYEYQKVYNETPTLFLSRNTLEYWRLSKGIVLPFKTNLMVVSQQDVTEISILDLIIAMTAYSEFKDDKVDVEYNNIVYSFDIGALYQLHQYFVAYADPSYSDLIPTFKGNMFPLEGSPPYALDPDAPNSIQHLVTLYNNITDKESTDAFWNEITNNYSTYLSGTTDISDIRSKLASMVSLELVKNLEDIIDSAMTRLDGLCQVLTILESVLGEYIENSDNPLVSMYEFWLRLLLSRPAGSVENSPTYKLLLEFKPYHTRFILESKFKVKYKDKTENTFVKDKVYFAHHIWHASAVVASDSYNIYITHYGRYYMVNGESSITQPCKDFTGLKIGDMITFIQGGAPDSQYPALQIVDIEKQNIKVTESQYIELKNLYPNKKFFSTLIEWLSDKIINNNDSDAIDAIKDINEIHEILFYNIEQSLDESKLISIYTDDSNYNLFSTVQLEQHLTDCADIIKEEFHKLQHNNYELYDLSKLFNIYDDIRNIYPLLENLKDAITDLTKFEETQSDGTIIIKTLDKLKIMDIYDTIIGSNLPYAYKKILSVPFTKDGSILEDKCDTLYVDMDKYKDVEYSLGFDIYNFLESYEWIKLIFDDIFVAFTNITDSYITVEYIDNLINSYLNQLTDPLQSNVSLLFNTLRGVPIDTSHYNLDGMNQFSISDHKIEKELHSVYNENELDLTYRLTKDAILLDYIQLNHIETVLATDDICTLLFDNPWEGPTGWYDQLRIETLPPVHDVVEPDNAQFTFTNIELAQYVHTNDSGFKSVYINDYIYVLEDDVKHAVKVIGKDPILRNLKIEKTYTGTAGTFGYIGRYRTGF